jgi:uncharacterized protein (DUF433 family)
MAEPRIVVHPSLGYGKPLVAGKWCLTSVIYDRVMGGEFGEALAKDYGLTLEEVRSVMAFEYWCRRRGRYDAPYAERLAREKLRYGAMLGAGGWPRQVWPRRGRG